MVVACPHSVGVRPPEGPGCPLGPPSVLWREPRVRHPPHDPGLSEAQRSGDLVKESPGEDCPERSLGVVLGSTLPRWGSVVLLLARVISGGLSHVLSSVGLQGRGVVFFWGALSAALVQLSCLCHSGVPATVGVGLGSGCWSATVAGSLEAGVAPPRPARGEPLDWGQGLPRECNAGHVQNHKHIECPTVLHPLAPFCFLCIASSAGLLFARVDPFLSKSSKSNRYVDLRQNIGKHQCKWWMDGAPQPGAGLMCGTPPGLTAVSVCEGLGRQLPQAPPD